MTWTEFLSNSYLEYNSDMINIIHNDNDQISCVVALEVFNEPDAGGYWFTEYNGLPKPTREEAEAAFELVAEFLTEDQDEAEENMSDYEFYKQTFGR